ncbi:MAG TPA: septum site-determining protein MinC [Chloroflexi bacterium]|nr:septum site-determining protein MinC [Chloroflexota bacterium]
MRRRVDTDLIAIKGIRQGLLVTLDEAGYWPSLLAALEARLNDNPAFFRGGRVVLDVQGRTLTRSEIESALAMCARHQVELWALLSTDAVTESAAQQLGLVVALNWPPAASQPVEVEDATHQENHSPLEGLVVQRTLRSGQGLRHPGHIVIIGDVNVGAEVVAGGNIVVWGRVRGVVHAGALGNESSVVCALDLAPTQLRIAGHIARSPEERSEEPVPEMAFVQDGHIVAVPWAGSRPAT